MPGDASPAVGRVVGLYRFPVKSMAGEPCDALHLGWQGFEHDRRFAFAFSGSLKGMPFVSARQRPGLISYQAQVEEREAPFAPRVVVRTPAGEVVDVEDPTLLEEIEQLAGKPVHLVHLHRGTFDAMAVSLVTTRSISTIAEILETELDVRRFRSNVVVEAFAERAFPEEKWIGRSILFGEGTDPARIRANRKPLRCSIVNLDPDTGVADVPVHRAIVQRRRNELGVWGSPERTGVVRLGDAVHLR
jgi:uncharacterized protein YcbX